jgi:hypothetical protein
MLVANDVVTSSPILVTLMVEAILSSEQSVLSRAMQCNIPECGILHRNFLFFNCCGWRQWCLFQFLINYDICKTSGYHGGDYWECSLQKSHGVTSHMRELFNYETYFQFRISCIPTKLWNGLRLSRRLLWIMASSGMLRRVALVRTDVSRNFAPSSLGWRWTSNNVGRN